MKAFFSPGMVMLVLLLSLSAQGCGSVCPISLQSGDIIFHTSQSSQSVAIQRATRSRYSHMGLILLRGRKVFVFEAAKTVRYTPLDQWVARGEGQRFIVKRLRQADQIVTPDNLVKLQNIAKKFEGKPYDSTFEWSDDRIYCSELVWKIYDQALGIQLGHLQKLREFNLADSVVKRKLAERYGEQVPLDETVISPASIFESDKLMTVFQE